MGSRRTVPAAVCALLLTGCGGGGTALPTLPAAVERTSARAAAGGGWQHDWARGAVFYEVYVRSFQDSDGDGLGDLRGLISRLDYLSDGNPATTTDLGVDAIYLMPVYPSRSAHGYDVTDFDDIDPVYGSRNDFARLCDEAHRRGMKVLLDLPLNHTSDRHPWFTAGSTIGSPRRDWYVWSATDPGWTQPWSSVPAWHRGVDQFYYGLFGGDMPDLNYRNPAVREEARAIALQWLSRGADGFRLDSARYLIETGPGAGQQDTAETHAFWKELAAAVRAARPDALLVGEAWADTDVIAPYFGTSDGAGGTDEISMMFDFPVAQSIVEAVSRGNGARLAPLLQRLPGAYPSGALDAPLLGNHDQQRVASQLGGRSEAVRMAASVLLTLPGTPFVYYGEELGLQNGSGSGDLAQRAPMTWNSSTSAGFTTGTPWLPLPPGASRQNVAAETDDPASLLSRYRSLIRVRHESPALATGSLQMLTGNSPSPLIAYLRTAGTEQLLVVHNLGESPESAGPFPIVAASAERLFADPGVGTPAGDPDGWRVAMPAHTSAVFRLR